MIRFFFFVCTSLQKALLYEYGIRRITFLVAQRVWNYFLDIIKDAFLIEAFLLNMFAD